MVLLVRQLQLGYRYHYDKSSLRLLRVGCDLRIRLVRRWSLQHVEDPVAGVERRETDREDHPRVLVDHVDVLDLRDGRLDDGRSAPDRVQHLRSVVT